MKVSHMILKTKDLKQAVNEYREKGFEVEYGSAKNPYNAIIYFSEGPYLELLASTGMPGFVKKLLRLAGKGKFVDRMDFWENHPGGLCGLALETYEPTLEKEQKLLEQENQGYFMTNSRRDDTKGRKLRFTCLFPYDLQIPFLMTYFNIDPKPKNFVHPNGAKKITSVAFGTKKEYIPFIQSLCDDPTLALFVGDGIRDMEIEYETKSKENENNF
ncbi:VOC family protein [Clostridium minihomine]|uniref:VOC family protein n=1 Tax=Clostridium minihomine TaxID=2045012 RepID=UPI000C76379C|nr:VOC family protein [Clostridium minihomine]